MCVACCLCRPPCFIIKISNYSQTGKSTPNRIWKRPEGKGGDFWYGKEKALEKEKVFYSML